jgi:DNA-binding beta-propeller fold protein YncE
VSLSGDGSFALVADRDNHRIRHVTIATGSVTTFAGSSGGSANGLGTNSQLNGPVGVSVTADGSFALVADTNNNLIRQLVLSTSSVTTLAGSSPSGSSNGVGTNAKFNYPTGVSVSADGSFALVAEYNNHLIRQVIIATGSVTTLVGSSGGFANGLGTNSVQRSCWSEYLWRCLFCSRYRI